MKKIIKVTIMMISIFLAGISVKAEVVLEEQNTITILGEAFNQPQGLCLDDENKIYVVDMYNNQIKVYDGLETQVFAGNNTDKDDYGFYIGGLKDGLLMDAMFNRPKDILYAGNGVFYVSDTGNNVIRKIEGDKVTTFAGNGQAGKLDGKSQSASFNAPAGMALSSEGILYVADTLNNCIRMIDEKGNVSTMTIDVDVNGSDAYLLNEPADVSLDHQGNIIILDSGNQQIKKLVNQQVEIIAGLNVVKNEDGYGEVDYVDGKLEEARFAYPKSIEIVDGIIYVADTWNHTIRMIKPDGYVATLVGNGAPGRELNKSGESLNGPSGIAIKSGTLYIADGVNNEIKSVDLNYGEKVFDLNKSLAWLNTQDQEGILVYVEDKNIDFMDAAPFVTTEGIYYPIRKISEALGADIQYSGLTKDVTITYKDKKYDYNIFADHIIVKNNRTYTDIRKLASALGFFVTVDEEAGHVLISEIK